MVGADALDDASISDDEILLRRVAPQQMLLEGDHIRLTSNAFNDVSDAQTGIRAISVFVESKVLELGFTPESMLDGLDGFGLVALTVGQVRALELGVTWAPNDQSMGPAHAHLNGSKPKAIRRRLAELAEERIWPDPRPRP